MTADPAAGSGFVYLVGAGPGDPGLLTVRGAKILRTAEVVVYDRLVSDDVLAMATARRRIYVGKSKGSQALDQEEINRLLVNLASEGRRVCRLKGGDPFVFGRGGEEAAHLAGAGVDFEVVPGVTSAIAAPAYAGIPVTDRRASASFACVTAHRRPSQPPIDWTSLARSCDTIVVLMGASRLDRVAGELAEAGLEASHPAAVVESGTLPDQRVIRGTLASIVRKAAEAGIGSPAVVVVGNVVNLADSIDWISRRPLHGVSVMVTRDEGSRGALSSRLRSLGAHVLGTPTIRILPLEDESGLHNAVAGIGSHDWVVFASASAVVHVFGIIERDGGDARALAPCRVAVMGRGTGAALRERGILPDLIPESYVSESLAKALLEKLESGSRIVIFGALGGRDLLARELGAAGHDVSLVSSYRNVPVAVDPKRVEALKSGGVDWIAFTSSSSVTRLVKALGGAGNISAKTRVACIGPTTAATAEALDLRVAAVSEDHTIEGLARTIAQFSKRPVE
ncbi:MAG: uroporphyrinogen-III C-methyltransferase [Chloroflexi bacterium]|nr:uroporphyrinogen-III C-methyltransferase [Chloroflexota bacterium]